jgi:hypothetical protein
MSLKKWSEHGWLRPHRTSKEEIINLLQMVNRDLKDAEQDISSDRKFGIAYSAALRLFTVLLYAEGYRAERIQHHYRTIQALPLILGEKRKADAQYLDTCRTKRNIVEYDYMGSVTEDDAKELIEFSKELKKEVIDWLMAKHSELV